MAVKAEQQAQADKGVAWAKPGNEKGDLAAKPGNDKGIIVSLDARPGQ